MMPVKWRGTATTAAANVGDPVTQVITAAAGQGVRMRLLEPTGAGRGTTFNLHGHAWQRAPYIFKDVEGGQVIAGKPIYEPERGDVASQRIGDNWLGMVLGHQESITPAAHFDIVPTSTSCRCTAPVVKPRFRVTTCSVTRVRLAPPAACGGSCGLRSSWSKATCDRPMSVTGIFASWIIDEV